MIAGELQEITRADQLAISTTSIKVADPVTTPLNERKVITLRNTSPNADDVITVSFGQSPSVANKGIVLRQYESFTDSTDAGYKAFQGQINAICATANGLLSIYER